MFAIPRVERLTSSAVSTRGGVDTAPLQRRDAGWQSAAFFQLPATLWDSTRRIDRHEASLERDGSRRCAGAGRAGVGANKRADDSVISRRTRSEERRVGKE